MNIILCYLFVFLALLPFSIRFLSTRHKESPFSGKFGWAAVQLTHPSGSLGRCSSASPDDQAHDSGDTAPNHHVTTHAHGLCTPKLSNVDKQEECFCSGATLVAAVTRIGLRFSRFSS